MKCELVAEDEDGGLRLVAQYIVEALSCLGLHLPTQRWVKLADDDDADIAEDDKLLLAPCNTNLAT